MNIKYKVKQQTKDFLKELRQFGLTNDVPNITDENAGFLMNFVREKGFKNILEIGTANGYSTICFASIMEENNGHITSIEFSILSHSQAITNIKSAGLEDFVTLLHGQALDIIPVLEDKSFDFIFIDGMKRRSKDFLELSLPKLIDSGTIIIDDVIKFKDKMIGLYEFLEENKLNYEVIKIDEDDGIMIISK